MLRNVGTVLAAMALSVLLTSLGGWLLARSPQTHLMLEVGKDARSGKEIPPERARALWAALEQGRFRYAWIYCPAVALLVGSFTGALSRTGSWKLAPLGVAPFAILFSVGISGLAGTGFLALYLAISAAAAYGTARLWAGKPEGANRPTTG